MFDAKKLLDQIMGGEAAGTDARKGLDEVGGLIGAVFGQATTGLKEGAAEIESRTGVGSKAGEALERATGKSAKEIVEDVKGIASRNQLATGAALAGVGALLLGTKGGRGLARNAAAVGGLALLGGLAYKAWRNHEAGKPLIDRPGDGSSTVAPAPDDSPFGETGDETRDQAAARLMLQAMIAGAAADGMVDNEERSRIVGALERAGLDVMAAKFLDHEFAHPATVDALAVAATTQEMKIQVYAAAVVGVGAESAAERGFLADLAARLGLSPAETTQIASSVAAVRSA